MLWLANCCFAHISLGFPFLLRFCDEQSRPSFCPFPCYPGPLAVARSRQRSPNLCTSDRILAGLMALLVRPTRLLRSAIVLKPSTLLGLHKALSKQKYRVLFCPNRRLKPGPKGPRAELIRAVVEMKQRNPNWGCPRILSVPHPNQQRRGSKDSRPSLPAGTFLRWSFLADVPGPHERQPLEHGTYDTLPIIRTFLRESRLFVLAIRSKANRSLLLGRCIAKVD